MHSCQSFRRSVIWPILILLIAIHVATNGIRAGEPSTGFEREAWNQLIAQMEQLRERLDAMGFDLATGGRSDDLWADAQIFRKGLDWAIEFDRTFEPKDVALMTKAAARGMKRLRTLERMADMPPWAGKRGKVIRGYTSRIDGSTQPYGIIVPTGYDGSRPMRLDVVLHGSTRPVGLSELRFIDRFDAGDVMDANESAPDVEYLELHPLGRVENGYRWAGETDVFEAIEAACRQYRVDRDRIVLRGMSMGASGTWHLGLKHPDRFVALGPYCGYVDTRRFSQTPLSNFVRVGSLPTAQEQTLHLLDSVDYAANAGIVPAIACMGEQDVFFEAHVIMGQAMSREGLTMVNLISPGTGHVIDPRTHAEQMRRIGEHARRGLNRVPQSLRFVTWSLKYNRCHWLRLLKLERHYERSELVARRDEQGTLLIEEPRNIARFAIDPPMLTAEQSRVRVGGNDLALPPRRNAADSARPYLFAKQGKSWSVELSPGVERGDESASGKRPGLQGPIDDAFTSPFVCVRGTGTPWNATAVAAANASLKRFAYEWRRYFRGELVIKNDVDIDEYDLRKANLILFGDPGSNRWIRESLAHLPISWDQKTLRVAGKTYSSADHLPALIVPNPLPGAGQRYLVLNSGHTFHESELSTLNYLLYPRQGDWSVLKVAEPRPDAKSPSDAVVEQPIDFGLADEEWRIGT